MHNDCDGGACCACAWDEERADSNAPARPLTWETKGSHLSTADALGLKYAITGSAFGYRATIRGEELYRGDDIEAAKVACETHWQAAFARQFRS